MKSALDSLRDLIFIDRINNLYDVLYRIEEGKSEADMNELQYQTLRIP